MAVGGVLMAPPWGVWYVGVVQGFWRLEGLCRGARLLGVFFKGLDF